MNAIKSRLITHKEYFVGEDGNDGFIHLQVRLLAGRTEQQKTMLADKLEVCLSKFFEFVEISCALSVEIVDMDPQVYRKKRLV